MKALYQKGKEKLFGKRKPKRPKETAQQKLARVIAIIGPQLASWFSRGIGRISLAAGLKYLQVRHLLRSLKATTASDGQVRVLARVNPEGVAALAWSPKWVELRRLIDEIAGNLLRDPQVVAAAANMRGKGMSPDDPVVIKSGADYLAAATMLQTAERRPTHYLIGEHQPVARESQQLTGIPLQVHPGRISAESSSLFEKQNRALAAMAAAPGSDPFDVAGLDARQAGKLVALSAHQLADERKVGSYSKVERTLRELGGRSTAGSAPRGADLLTTFMQTGRSNLSTKSDRERLGRVAGLLYTVETARDPSHIADAAMASELIGKPRGLLAEVVGGKREDPLTLSDLFVHPGKEGERPQRVSRGRIRPAGKEGELLQGGILPLTHPGAQAGAFHLGAADVAADIDLMGTGGVRGQNQERLALGSGLNKHERDAAALAHRRMLLAQRWVEIRLETDPEVFKDRASAKAAIERHLRDFYNLASSKVGTPPTTGAAR